MISDQRKEAGQLEPFSVRSSLITGTWPAGWALGCTGGCGSCCAVCFVE